MTPYPTERIALFIDGANLYSAAKALNADLDFKKLVELYRAQAVLVRAYYYTAVIEGEEFSPISSTPSPETLALGWTVLGPRVRGDERTRR